MIVWGKVWGVAANLGHPRGVRGVEGINMEFNNTLFHGKLNVSPGNSWGGAIIFRLSYRNLWDRPPALSLVEGYVLHSGPIVPRRAQIQKPVRFLDE